MAVKTGSVKISVPSAGVTGSVNARYILTGGGAIWAYDEGTTTKSATSGGSATKSASFVMPEGATVTSVAVTSSASNGGTITFSAVGCTFSSANADRIKNYYNAHPDVRTVKLTYSYQGISIKCASQFSNTTSITTVGTTKTFPQSASSTMYGVLTINYQYDDGTAAKDCNIAIETTKGSYTTNETITATTTVSGSDFSYYTVQWLSNSEVIQNDATHYTSARSHTSTLYNTADKVGSGVVKVTAYDSTGTAIKTAAASFTIVLAPPANIFNIEKFGVAAGQMAEGTEENPKFTVNYPAQFNSKVTARHDFTISDGWHPLTLGSGISTYDCGAYGPGAAYRVEGGNHVYVSAGLRGFTAKASEVILATGIPAKYRPAQNIWCLAYCETTSGLPRIYRCVVTTTGQLQARFEYHIGTSSTGLTDAIGILDILCEYWVD